MWYRDRTDFALKWNFASASTRIHQDVKEAAYKWLVRLVLEYDSSAWGLQGVVLQEELEGVQKRTKARSRIRNRKFQLLLKK